MDPTIMLMDMKMYLPQCPRDRDYSLGIDPQLTLYSSKDQESRPIERPRSDSPHEDERRRKRVFQSNQQV